MDGGTLEDRLESGEFAIDEALWIGECLCRGLKIAHDHGIAHLDLKPANVIFRKTSEDLWDVPKIADWGLARVLAERLEAPVAYSAEYAAPEQFDDTKFGSPDMYTDIYQLGAAVYAMLTGRPPYTGTRTEVMHAVTGDNQPVPPEPRRAEVPSARSDTVLTAHAHSRSDQHTDISRFLEQLRTVRLGRSQIEPISQQPANSQTDSGDMNTPGEADNVSEPLSTHAHGETESDFDQAQRSNTEKAPAQPLQDDQLPETNTGWFDPSTFPEARSRELSAELQAPATPDDESLPTAFQSISETSLADALSTIYQDG
jgi:serine/threonine protein kinase